MGKLKDLPIFNIPWGHNIAIFEGVKSLDERLWYVKGVAEYETKIISTLPKKLERQLPIIDEIEAELSAIPSPKVKRVKKKKNN